MANSENGENTTKIVDNLQQKNGNRLHNVKRQIKLSKLAADQRKFCEINIYVIIAEEHLVRGIYERQCSEILRWEG